jgi:phosphoenolpyruvate phosphomutase
VERCKKQQVDPVVVVAGYKADTIDVAGIELVINERHETTGELVSLACTRHLFRDDMIILYGDLIFRSYILRGLIESDRELTVVVDSQATTRTASGTPDYAYCSVPDDRSLWGQDVLLERVDPEPERANRRTDGRWIGMLRTRARGRQWLAESLDELSARPDFAELSMRDLINHLVAQGRSIRVIYIHGHWLDVNSLSDLEHAGEFTAGQR